MVAAKSILASVLVIGMAYAAYPYVTLYRLDHALRSGNAAALRTLVNWPAVREGIKEDICDHVADAPAQTVATNSLPAFGASFARGIATTAVDQRVTPQGLVDMTHHNAPPANASSVALHVTWAFFDSPTDFVVSLAAPGEPGPIRLQLTLKDASWKVTRIWLPQMLLHEANGT